MKLSKLNKVALREIWKHEALGFTKWLAEEPNLTMLGEELGIELVSAQTEVHVGDFHLDILAQDSNENKVVIENQLEPTNHDHLGKLITYASGLQASTIVWIVSRARQEHEQAINWLNEHTDENANFFLIEIEVWKIDNSPPAPKFNIVAEPNDWAKVVKQSSGNKVTEFKLEQQAFWDALREYASEKPSKYLKSWQKALPQHWYNISIGSSRAKLSGLINSRKDQVGVELYIYEDKDLFSALYEQKDKIELETGFSLEWMELPGRKSSRIAIFRQGKFNDIEQRDELISWIYDTAEKLSKVFANHL